MYQKFFKPTLDFIISLLLLICLSPIIILVIVLLTITNNGDVFFLQKRPGLNKQPFQIIKFKTMRDQFDEYGLPLPDAERITKIGKLIRSLSLDELLQLINVLKGDMSLIGPRPLLMQYLDRYSIEQARRHEVKPGITGWAQINGRNTLSWEDKFKYDIEYLENISFLFDLKILIKTLFLVFKRKGINSGPNTTMEEFNPNKNTEISPLR